MKKQIIYVLWNVHLNGHYKHYKHSEEELESKIEEFIPEQNT